MPNEPLYTSVLRTSKRLVEASSPPELVDSFSSPEGLAEAVVRPFIDEKLLRCTWATTRAGKAPEPCPEDFR